MRSVAKILGLIVALTAAWMAPAFAALQVDVNQGNVQPLPIAIPDFMAAAPGRRQNIAGVVRADLERSGLFKPLDPKSFIEHDHQHQRAARPSPIGARSMRRALVTGEVTQQPDGRLRVDFRLWDVFGESQMLRHAISPRTPENWRRIAHMIVRRDLSAHHGREGLFRHPHRLHLGKRPAHQPHASGWPSWTKTAPIRSS